MKFKSLRIVLSEKADQEDHHLLKVKAVIENKDPDPRVVTDVADVVDVVYSEATVEDILREMKGNNMEVKETAESITMSLLEDPGMITLMIKAIPEREEEATMVEIEGTKTEVKLTTRDRGLADKTMTGELDIVNIIMKTTATLPE